MINGISFGNKYVSAATIFSEKAIKEAAQNASDAAQKMAKYSKGTVSNYTSPFAPTLSSNVAMPSVNKSAASYALSHGNLVDADGQKIIAIV